MVDFLKTVPQANPMDVLRTAVSMLGIYDPETPDMTPDANNRKALRLMAQTSTIVTTFDRLRKGLHVIGGRPVHELRRELPVHLTGKRPDDVMEHAFDVALTLHADHELNASTFAARVTAATLSDMYSSITSAIGALKGPLHGGANQDVIKILLQLSSEEAAIDRVKSTLARKVKIPGFGHRVYRDGRSAGHAFARALRGTGPAHRPGEAVPDVAGHGTDREGGERADRQRGFLLGLDLLCAGHSGGSVYAGLRGEPHVRLDGAHAGAIQEQPPDPAARGV